MGRLREARRVWKSMIHRPPTLTDSRPSEVLKSVQPNIVPFSLDCLKIVLLSLAKERFAPERSAPEKFAPERSDSVRSAPERLDLERSALKI